MLDLLYALAAVHFLRFFHFLLFLFWMDGEEVSDPRNSGPDAAEHSDSTQLHSSVRLDWPAVPIYEINSVKLRL